MSGSHKHTLQEMNRAILRLDFDAALEFCTGDTVWIFEGDRTLSGKQAVRDWMTATYRHPPVLNVDRMICEGDHLVAIGDIVVTDPAKGPVRSRYADVWRLCDGLLAELHAFVNEAG